MMQNSRQRILATPVQVSKLKNNFGQEAKKINEKGILK
jgi:hypothetical protein